MINICNKLASLEQPSFASLSKLEIKDCLLLVSFKVAQLPSLATLHLSSIGYDVIQQIKFVGAPSLKGWSFEFIDRLISLPKEELQHFSGLVRLHICACPNLASFNVASLTRLQELRQMGVRAEVLWQLMLAFSSLKLLYIWGIDICPRGAASTCFNSRISVHFELLWFRNITTVLDEQPLLT